MTVNTLKAFGNSHNFILPKISAEAIIFLFGEIFRK